MRKMLLLACLLGTTCLYPTHAHAMPPVAAAIGGIVSAINFAAVAATAAIQGALLGVGISAGLAGVLGGFLLNTALSLGLSYFASLLRPRPPSPKPSQRLVNLRQPIQDRTKSYGLVRVGGPVYFFEAKGNKRYVGIVTNTGEIDSIQSRWLDEREVTLDGTGLVTDAKFVSEGRSRVRIQEFRGNSAQAAPSLLLDNFTEWTSAHKLTGCAHAVMACENTRTEDFSDVYPSGREPTYTQLIRGTRCYDPRTETTVWTKNAALILADWFTSPDGLNREVDWDIVAEEADVCDQNVTNRAGSTQKRWELSGTYAFGEDRESVRASMAVACDAFIFETQDGKVGFRVGRYIEPTVTIVGKNVRSLRLTEGSEGTQIVNSMTVEYTEPANGFREEQAAAYVIDDDQPYEEDTVGAYWIPNHNQAVRVAKRVLLNSRAKYRAQMTLDLQGLRLIGQRFFRLDFDEAGLDETFEVSRLTLSDDGLSVEVEAVSVLESDFAFNAALEETAQPQRTDIETDLTIADPTGVTVEAQSIVSAGAVGVQLLVEWDEPDRDGLVYQVRFRVDGTTPWTTIQVSPGQFFQTIGPVSDGVAYEVELRALTSTARASNWVRAAPDPITAIADTTPPGPILDEDAVGGVGEVDLSWTAPNSANYIASRVYRNVTNTFGTATLVVTEFGSPNASDTYTDAGLAAGNYYYWIQSINGSGVAGTEVATGIVTVT